MSWVGWLVTTTLFLYVVAMIVKWSTTWHLPQLVVGWGQDAWTSFKRRGYLLLPMLIAAYAGIYGIIEARHERLANRALFERSTFMTMVSSGNRSTFVAAMKTFGRVQRRTVPYDPELLAPWTWFEQEKPNETPLYIWAVSFFPRCTAEACGDPDAQPKPWRIDLRQADLADSFLSEVDLRDANLYNADLRGAYLDSADLRGADLTVAFLDGADLTSTNLREATLRGATLRETDLSDANLRGADLTHPPPRRPEGIRPSVPYYRPPFVSTYRHPSLPRGADLTDATLDQTHLQGVDLREIFGLTQAQLNIACVNDLTQLPDGLTPPPSCYPARRSK